MYRLIILDTKLLGDTQAESVRELEEHISSFHPGLISCRVATNDAEMAADGDLVKGANVVLAHSSDYEPALKEHPDAYRHRPREVLIRAVTVRAHLYWTSSSRELVSKHEKTYSAMRYEQASVVADLPDARAYRTRLNWEGALAEWKAGLTEWQKAGAEEPIPALPLDTLTRVADLPTQLAPLAALDILLQGYLAIWEPEAVFGNKHQEFMREHQILATDDLRNAAEYKTQFLFDLNDPSQRLFRPGADSPFDAAEDIDDEPTGPSQRGWYWFDECLPDVAANSWGDLVSDCPELRDGALQRVWEILCGVCLGPERDDDLLTDLAAEDQSSLTELFAKAHQEYTALFEAAEKKSLDDDYEEFRNRLNHNLIKNEFLHVLGLSQLSDVEVRSRKIEAVWAHLRGEETDDPELQDKKNNMQSARKVWRTIEPLLQELFGPKLEECGLTLTPKGRQLKKELIDDVTGVVSTVSSFVDDFEKIGGLPQEERIERLRDFWTAADRLHEALSAMALRNDADGPFGGYVRRATDRQ